MAVTTTQRSLKYMRDNGFYAEVVERYNSFTKRKNDFAGFIDILCLGQGAVIGADHQLGPHIRPAKKDLGA